ncbi:MAG: ATP-binding cassette domain-containing protein [Ignavibacteria bacterium]|nr:ATP-binding cassette domain-containing protein [Ignavibacteria bacterium]
MISLENITVNFGTRILFDSIYFRISGRDRVGLIGPNGSGKTTLLKIIDGQFLHEKGRVIKSRHTTIGYLPQETIYKEGESLREEVTNSAGNISKIKEEIEITEQEMHGIKEKDSEEYFSLLDDYTFLNERYHLLDGHKITSKVEKILTGLGFRKEEFDRNINEFSGGWRMRAEIAKLLLNNPSILLLDEPTNHLDIDSLLWFEKYLKNYNGAIILVSHDRNFLNNITTRTADIKDSKLIQYAGNYDFYITEKEKRQETEESTYKNQMKYIKKQREFIERFRYKSTKASSVQSRIKMLDKIEIKPPDEEDKTIKFRFPSALHSGKLTVSLEKISKTYDGKEFILEGINYEIYRGEKIAVMGANGTGKSTLTRIIAGTDMPTSGRVKYGHMVKMKYFAQENIEQEYGDRTVMETLQSVSTDGSPEYLRNILGGFLFHGDDTDKKVSYLSGGEKSRLSLARMLTEQSNFLIFDEPTNHLDMQSKEFLRNALKEYEGTIIIVSHDRDFLEELTDKVIEIREKKIKTFTGKCSEYVIKKEAEILSREIPEKEDSRIEKTDTESQYFKNLRIKSRKKEVSKKIKKSEKNIREYEDKLLESEKRKTELEKLLSDENTYKDYNFVIEFKKEYKEILQIIDEYSSKWEQEINNLEILNNELNLIN